MTEEFGTGQLNPDPQPLNDSFWRILAGFFGSPSKLMDRVGSNPRWWPPGLLIFVVIVGFQMLILQDSIIEQLELSRDSMVMRMAPEGMWEEQYQAALDMSPLMIFLGSVRTGFITWILAIILGFTLGFFARMSGGKVGFKKAIAIVSWAAVPLYVFGSIVKLPLILQTESVLRVSIGLGGLLKNWDFTPFYIFLLFFGDLFVWWGVYLMVVGFSRNFDLSIRNASLCVVLPWALLYGIFMGMFMLSTV